MHGTEVRTPGVPVLELSETHLEEADALRLLANDSKGFAIITLDTAGHVLFWNKGAQSLTGYSADEILGEHSSRFYTPEDIAANKPTRALEQAAAEGRSESEGWRIGKNTERFWATDVLIALHNSSGQVIGFSKLLRDGTAFKQSAEESHFKYRQLIMLLPVAVYTTDVDGRITLYNAQAAQLFGRKPRVGADYWCGSYRLYSLDGCLLPPEKCPMAVAIREGRVVRGEEIVVERPDGSRSCVIPFPELIRDSAGKVTGAINVLIDVTARHKAEQALRESESFMRVLIDNLPFEFWARDSEERCTMQNATLVDHWGNILGLRPEESALSAEDAALWNSNNRRAFRGEIVHSEIQFKIRGETRPFEEIIAPVRIDGQIRGILGINIDITDRKKAESALRKSENQLRTFIEQAPVAIAMFDTQMRYLAASSRWLQTHNLAANVVGRSHYDCSPEIPEHWKAVHRRTMAGDVERSDVDRFLRADGSSIWITWEVRPWFAADGSIGGIVIFTEDITRRLQTEEALRQSELRFRTLAEGIPQLVWTALPDGSGDYASRQWSEYTGTPQSEQKGDRWLSQVYSEDRERVRQQWQESVVQVTPFEMEYRLKRFDGEYRWFKAVGVPVFADAGNLIKWFGTSTDIQTQKDAEAALDCARAQTANHAALLEQEVAERTAHLRATVSELEAFSYSVSHDLRSPLRAMHGYAQALLEDYSDRLDQSGKAYLARIERAANRLDRLIQDILAYSRVARGDLPLGPVNLELLIDDVIQNYPAFHDAMAEITIDRSILPVVGNEGSLTQCISNLLSNAVKFVAPGVLPKVRIWTEPVDSNVRIWIQDNGIGIDQTNFQRIFQIFGRVHPSEQFEGTGIGLSIVKKAVERMGGTLGVESTPGQGSRFWIQLPTGRA